MKIGTVEIGPGHPCRIVAECSNSHNGSFDRLMRMLVAARAAGADIAKIQAFTPDEMVALRGDGPAPEPWGSQGWNMRSLYTKAATPLEWLPAVFEGAAQIGVTLFSSVFGPESLAALETVNCPAYKISHFESANGMLAQLVLATDKPVIVSTDGLSLADHYRYRLNEYVMLLYCPGGYPAAPAEMHLRSAPLRCDGLSSHCRDPLVAPLAVACEAELLEYHFHLEAQPSELESNVSLNEREFRAMVDSVRQAEVLLG